MNEEAKEHRAHRHPKEPLVWEAYEHPYKEKSTDWYWVVGIIALACAIAALLFNNVMFAVMIVIGAIVIAIVSSRPPNLVTFELSERGVRIDSSFYPFRTLDAYWVEDRFKHQEPRLLIKSSSWLNHLMVIPLVGVDVHRVHLFMEEHLPEEEIREPFAHHLMELFEL